MPQSGREGTDLLMFFEFGFGTTDTGANASAEGADDALDDQAEKVNNIIHSFRLQPTQFDKKTFLTYLKGANGPRSQSKPLLHVTRSARRKTNH